jgi:hypothetical protein
LVKQKHIKAAHRNSGEIHLMKSLKLRISQRRWKR